MIGMGAVITRSVPAYTLVVGVPALPVALVCRCGRPIANLVNAKPKDGGYDCTACEVQYQVMAGRVVHDPHDSEVVAAAPVGEVDAAAGPYPTPTELAS
jgi:hypothetical protein